MTTFLQKITKNGKEPQFVFALTVTHIILTTILYFIGKKINEQEKFIKKVTWFGMHFVVAGFWVVMFLILVLLEMNGNVKSKKN